MSEQIENSIKEYVELNIKKKEIEEKMKTISKHAGFLLKEKGLEYWNSDIGTIRISSRTTNTLDKDKIKEWLTKEQVEEATTISISEVVTIMSVESKQKQKKFLESKE